MNATTPKGRMVTIGSTHDGGVNEAKGIGRYIETQVLFGTVKVSSFGYYSQLTLPAALVAADKFIDECGLGKAGQ
mgnify:CR=1 FL=1